MKLGDKVLFHYIEAHMCGGKNCECDELAPRETRTATVTGFVFGDDVPPDTLTLDVDFGEKEMALHGWAKDQSHVIRATKAPPETGSWTPMAIAEAKA